MSLLKLDESKVSKAVQGLLELHKKIEQKDNLLDEVGHVQMQVCLKKIPPKEKTIKLDLPHSLSQPDMDVCLFVKDLDKEDRDYEPTVRHFKELFQKRGINLVTEIIPLKSLKTEYKPYEAKKNLSNAYDIFLADARIVRLLPTYLGKHFYGKKKTPVQVNLQAKDLAKEVKTAVSNSRCVISSKGSSSLAVVAHLQMSPSQIVENVIASAEHISASIPGGFNNIKQLCVKTRTSTSLPIFLSAGGPQDVQIPKEERKEPVEAEEVSTVFGAKVKVFPNGNIKIIKDGEVEEEQKKRRRKTGRKKKSAVLKRKTRTKASGQPKSKKAKKSAAGN